MGCGVSLATNRFGKAIRFPLNSLRYRLIVTVVAIETVMLLILVWSYSVDIRRTHEERLRDTASVVLEQFVATAGRYLVEVDYPSLAEYARRVLKHEEVAHVNVRNAEGQVILELGGPAPRRSGDAGSNAAPMLEVSSDVMLGGKRRGRVQLGFSEVVMKRAVAESRQHGIMIASAEIALSVLAALLIGFALTSNLRSLATAAARFGRGESDVTVPISSRDEVGQVAIAFNEMVAERARVEELLRQSEQRLRVVAEATPVPIGIARISDGMFLYCNPLVGPAFGLPPEAMVGRCIPEFYVDPDHWRKMIAELQNKGSLRDYEIEYRRADGSRLNILLNAHEMNSDGEEALVFGLFDITERKRTEAQLVQALKMEAVGQLTGGVAHDFNNLLTVIRGNLELMERENSSGKTSNHLRRALQAVSRGSDLTHRLLAFSRRQILLPETIDANALVTRVTEMLDRPLGETIRVDVDLSPGLWPILVDPGQLESCLVNLAVNARDAMPGGGTLKIATANRVLGQDEAGDDNEPPPGEYVAVEVTDTGTGMTPEVLAHIFEPFFTTKEVGMGSGLGLSMAYGFTKQSGGYLDASSEPGRGTTFRFLFPRAKTVEKSPADPAEQAEQADPVPLGRGETVLVVEDDPEVRAMAVRMASDLGYTVLEAKDGLTALEMLDRHSEIDLLFTDMVMPSGLTGGELAERALVSKPRLKVLFMSGYSEEFLVERGSPVSGAQLMSKPFTRTELAQMMRQTLDTA